MNRCTQVMKQIFFATLLYLSIFVLSQSTLYTVDFYKLLSACNKVFFLQLSTFYVVFLFEKMSLVTEVEMCTNRLVCAYRRGRVVDKHILNSSCQNISSWPSIYCDFCELSQGCNHVFKVGGSDFLVQGITTVLPFYRKNQTGLPSLVQSVT